MFMLPKDIFHGWQDDRRMLTTNREIADHGSLDRRFRRRRTIPPSAGRASCRRATFRDVPPHLEANVRSSDESGI